MMRRTPANVGPSTRVVFSAYQDSRKGEIGFQMVLADDQGRRVMRASTTFAPYLPTGFPAVGMAPDPDDVPILPGPENSKRLTDFRVLLASNGKELGGLRPSLMHPEETDPATMLLGPALLAIADAKKLNAVIDVPDPVMPEIVYITPQHPYDADQLLEAARTPSVSRKKTAGSWEGPTCRCSMRPIGPTGRFWRSTSSSGHRALRLHWLRVFEKAIISRKCAC
jgi:hypothetical protein